MILLLAAKTPHSIISLIYDSLICQKDTEKTELSERCSKYHKACGIILHLLYFTTVLQQIHNKQYHTCCSKYPCLFIICTFLQIVLSHIGKCAYLRVEGGYIISCHTTRIFGFPQLQNANLTPNCPYQQMQWRYDVILGWATSVSLRRQNAKLTFLT